MGGRQPAGPVLVVTGRVGQQVSERTHEVGRVGPVAAMEPPWRREHDSRMVLTGSGPVPGDPGEVAGVLGDDGPVVRRGHTEQLVVSELRQDGIVRGRDHVVSGGPEPFGRARLHCDCQAGASPGWVADRPCRVHIVRVGADGTAQSIKDGATRLAGLGSRGVRRGDRPSLGAQRDVGRRHRRSALRRIRGAAPLVAATSRPQQLLDAVIPGCRRSTVRMWAKPACS
jgi:hypothetical protein